MDKNDYKMFTNIYFRGIMPAEVIFVKVEDALRELMVSRYGTVKEFSAAAGIPYSTVLTILQRGVNKATIQNINIVCKELKISADALAVGKIEPTSSSGPVDAVLAVLVHIWNTQLNNLGKNRLLEYANDLVGNQRYCK